MLHFTGLEGVDSRVLARLVSSWGAGVSAPSEMGTLALESLSLESMVSLHLAAVPIEQSESFLCKIFSLHLFRKLVKPN